jgi:ferredoxin
VIDAQQVPRRAEQQMEQRRHPPPGQPRGRHLETAGLRELLLENLEHEEWEKVAARCLACGNCTLVCPTCFCSRVDEVNDLLDQSVHRVQSWDSCFTAEHSYMNSGTVRKATAARYRQWLTHKLATWHDQFGSSGCVGCGRCITWCPVGIDLTAEVAAIRGGNP